MEMDDQIITGPRATPSPEVNAIFDAILAFMADVYISTSAYITKDGSALVMSLTATEPDGRQVTYTDRIPGQRVSISPIGAMLGPGQTAQFTATVTESNGVPVTPAPTITWSVAGAGTIDAAGLYTAPATIAAASSATIRAQASADAWSITIVNLSVTPV